MPTAQFSLRNTRHSMRINRRFVQDTKFSMAIERFSIAIENCFVQDAKRLLRI